MTGKMVRVELPNGQFVDDVPEGMTQTELLDMLARNKAISTEDAAAWGLSTPPETPQEAPVATPEAPATPVSDDLESRLPASMRTPASTQDGPTWAEAAETVGTTVAGNLDVPGSIGGAVLGAKAGVPAGPMGILAGTVIGGAVGSFGGDILSDYMMSEDPNMSEAVTNAAIGAGVDVVTLGAASKFKAAAKILGFEGDELAKLWKTYTTKAPEVKAPAGQALPVGSQASKEQTQALLQEKGGSLTAYQTGKANSAQRIAEGVGEVGIISSAGYRSQEAANAKIIADGLQEIVDTGWSSTGRDMGSAVAGAIDAGKEGASALYEKSMQEVAAQTKGITVQPKWLVGQIENWKKAGRKSWGSTHSTEALRMASEWQEQFAKMPSMSVSDLLAFQKKFNSQISDMGTFGADAVSKRASRDLADLSTKIRTTTEALLKDKSPSAHKLYTKANGDYGSAMEGLLPKLNMSQITSAKKGDYESLARVLEGQNPDKVEALMNSIDVAYKQANEAGVDVWDHGGVATAKEARELIKGQWMRNIFGEISSEGFDPTSFKDLASFYEKPANRRTAQAILGDDFGRFKMLVNAMDEATDKQSGFLGALVLRGKEHQAISGAMQGGGAVAGGPFAAAPILLGPVFLRHAVSSPKAVARLLEGNKRAGAALVGGKTARATEIMENTISAIMNGFSDEQQAEVRQSTRQGEQ